MFNDLTITENIVDIIVIENKSPGVFILCQIHIFIMGIISLYIVS